MSSIPQTGSGAGSQPYGGEGSAIDPSNPVVNLATIVTNGAQKQVVCYLQAGENGTNDRIGVRISAVFVVMILSFATTLFPVLATRVKSLRIPIYVYLFARYFGAGVIIATAFIHLLEPAYEEIGPNTCVGMTAGWNQYTWVPALALASSMSVFLMDFYAERYVQKKYGTSHGTQSAPGGAVDAALLRYDIGNDRRISTHQALHSADQDPQLRAQLQEASAGHNGKAMEDGKGEMYSLSESEQESLAEKSFQQQIGAFLILEFGVLFHSVIIGLTLGSAGDEFNVLYPVIVFHQAFEGLGIGARLSAIAFPKRLRWMPYALCAGYGLTTPISIAIGIGVGETYNAGSFTANIVSGVLDSISAGILLYTGFVELLARDFLFNPDRTDDDKQLAFMLGSVFLGAGVMALLGKWA
ncbi:Zinc-regulated transporter 1 [Lecanosticta acicola]|uniref:Zinc-regulated transporter 1 n=1 Tax=Lecanosticta acicola TaxID=111012 RepID=A0AAI8Z9L2_9PEZI|nr:Zinc-regulated transporter 1 [Lecanosticta acicola]